MAGAFSESCYQRLLAEHWDEAAWLFEQLQEQLALWMRDNTYCQEVEQRLARHLTALLADTPRTLQHIATLYTAEDDEPLAAGEWQTMMCLYWATGHYSNINTRLHHEPLNHNRLQQFVLALQMADGLTASPPTNHLQNQSEGAALQHWRLAGFADLNGESDPLPCLIRFADHPATTDEGRQTLIRQWARLLPPHRLLPALFERDTSQGACEESLWLHLLHDNTDYVRQRLPLVQNPLLKAQLTITLDNRATIKHNTLCHQPEWLLALGLDGTRQHLPTLSRYLDVPGCRYMAAAAIHYLTGNQADKTSLLYLPPDDADTPLLKPEETGQEVIWIDPSSNQWQANMEAEADNPPHISLSRQHLGRPATPPELLEILQHSSNQRLRQQVYRELKLRWKMPVCLDLQAPPGSFSRAFEAAIAWHEKSLNKPVKSSSGADDEGETHYGSIA